MSDDLERIPRSADSSIRHESRSDMEQAVGRKERRRIIARQSAERSVWFGLGMFGVVGWSIAVPTVAGIAVGLWIDTKFDSPRSWTLMLMVGGLALGCFNAWAWVQREAGSETASTERKDSDHA